ncbi:hypothetical protein CF8_0089 [Aeromonas phage CF8]|nr:hypothetical protein CF8_0089 [Aeromonas phage CF8]
MRIVSIAIVDKDIYLGTVYCEDKYIDKVLLMFPGFTKLGTDYNPNKKDYGVTYLHLKQFDFPAIYGYAHKHENESLNKLVFEHAEDITVRVCGLGMLACFEQIKQEQFLSLPDPHKQEQEDEANMDLEQKYQANNSCNSSPSLKTFLELSETMDGVGLTLTPEQENKLLHDAINELQEEIRSLNNQLAKKNQYDLDA